MNVLVQPENDSFEVMVLVSCFSSAASTSSLTSFVANVYLPL